jgi:hypothetical protein
MTRHQKVLDFSGRFVYHSRRQQYLLNIKFDLSQLAETVLNEQKNTKYSPSRHRRAPVLSISMEAIDDANE